MMHRNPLSASIVISILAASAGGGCSDVAGQSPTDESVQATRDAIINGTAVSASQVQTLGLAAVYHFDPPTNSWFPRPCSGKIIRSVNGVSKVITARHCVTVTGAIGGTLLSASQVRISPAASPGPAAPTPPSSAITASSVVGAPVDTTVPEEQRDEAVITVNANWSAQAASKDALWVGDPSLLIGFNMTSYGYGINVADWNCDADLSTVGAGVARSGGPFKVLSSNRTRTYGTYTTQNNNPSGQGVICGDSGGPDMLSLFATSPPKLHYAGTHSTGTASFATNPIPSFWLQQQLGGGFMSAFFSTLNVGVDDANVLLAVPSGDGRSIGMAYHMDLKQIRLVVSSSVCLAFGVRSTDQSTGAITESCGTGGSNETWRMTVDQRFTNPGADGLCLTLSSNNRLDLRPCLDARDGNVWQQRWLFHPQP
jgi:hypothetical protein